MMKSLTNALNFALADLGAHLKGRNSASAVGEEISAHDETPSFDVPRLAEEYLRLRAACKTFQSRLAEQVIRSGRMDDAARKLGILRGRTLVMESEHDLSVLIDHAIYRERQDGMTILEWGARESPPTNPDESRWLEAMRNSYYSIFLITDIVPKLGMVMRDVFSGQQILVADINLSRTATPGYALATRMLPFDQFWSTGGAGLPILHEKTLSTIRSFVDHRFPRLADVRALGEQDASDFQTFITRTCLAASYADNFSSEDPGTISRREWNSAPRGPAGTYSRKMKIGRNERCPCGSGEKFKRCCGRGVR